MREMSKRLIAFMTVLMLLIGAGAALAETPKVDVPVPYKVLEAGGAIGFEGSLNLDAASLKGLLMMTLGTSPADESASAVVDALFGAVNKLRFTSVYDKTTVSGVLGTDAGELITFQVAANEASMANSITTNLLPGIALQMDPQMLKAAMGQQRADVTPEKVMEMLAPYSEVLISFFNSKLGPKPEAGASPYDIAGIGQFHHMTEYRLTSKDVAELVEKLFEVFEKDQKLQSLVQKAANESGQENVKAAFDLKQMEEEVAKLKQAEEVLLLTGTAYGTQDNNTVYFVMDTPDTEKEKAHITVLVNNDEATGADVKVKVLVKNPEPATYPAPEATEPAPVAAAPDWLALEADILGGQNMRDVLVTVETNVKPGEKEMTSTFKANLVATGMNITLDGEGSSQMEKLFSQTVLRLGMGGPNPMLTLTGKIFETAEKPVAPALDGLQVVTLKTGDNGEMVLSDEAAVMNSLQKGLPLLMENLNKALPQEGPALVMLITQILSPQEDGMVEEETVVVEATEDTQEPVQTEEPAETEAPADETAAPVETEAPAETAKP